MFELRGVPPVTGSASARHALQMALALVALLLTHPAAAAQDPRADGARPTPLQTSATRGWPAIVRSADRTPVRSRSVQASIATAVLTASERSSAGCAASATAWVRSTGSSVRGPATPFACFSTPSGCGRRAWCRRRRSRCCASGRRCGRKRCTSVPGAPAHAARPVYAAFNVGCVRSDTGLDRWTGGSGPVRATRSSGSSATTA